MSKQQFARAVSSWADGKPMEFRVAPGSTDYGSSDKWHPMDNPWYGENFQYRIGVPLSEVERLNLMSAMHEGDD